MTRVVVQRNVNNNSNSAQGRQSLSAPQSTTTSLPSSANSSTSSHPQSHSSSVCLPVPCFGEDVGGRGGQEEIEQLSIHVEDALSFGNELNNRLVPTGGVFEGKANDRYHLQGEHVEDICQLCRADDFIEGTGNGVQLSAEWNGESSEGGIGVSGCGRRAGKGKEVAEDGRLLDFGTADDHREESSSEGSTVVKTRISAGPSNDRSHTREAIDPQDVQIRSLVSPHGQTGAANFVHSPSPHKLAEVASLPEPDQGRPNSSQSPSEGVGCSYLPVSAPPAPSSSPSAPSSSPSSRRNSWLGSSGSPGPASRGGLSRRGSRSKPARNSPSRSRPSSPRAYGEGDGYNSSDEHNPRSAGSTFENNDEREHQFEVEIRTTRNLEVRRMAEDGNCLFRAVADQVYGDAEMYNDTRQMCIDYMEKERDHFSQFVTESFTSYCKRKRRDKVYGNNLEIQAMAEMYNRPIHIYSHSPEPINIFHGSYETDLPPIRLSYHRGNHYDSLIDPGRPAVGAGLGFGSLRGTNVDREQIKAALKAQQDQQIDKALLAEGRFYSDIELTEQEIQRMVMEASRAEFFEEEKHRQFTSWSDETSTSGAAAEPSSSGTTGSSGNSLQTAVSLGATSTAAAAAASAPDSAGLTPNVRLLISMGFSYLQVMEAHSIFGDDVNNMLCYLLETENGNFGHGESMYRNKGKAAER